MPFTADEGGQIRVSLGRDFQRGSIDLNIKHFDDQVMLQAGVPLKFDADGKPSDVPGFDALSGTLSGPETERLTLRGANGAFDWDLSRGTDVELTQYTAVFKYDLGAGGDFSNPPIPEARLITDPCEGRSASNARRQDRPFPAGGISALG